MKSVKNWERSGMTYKLSDICTFTDERVVVTNLDLNNYISTENMLQNKEGVIRSAGLPTVNQIQAYQPGDVLISNIRPYFKKIWFADRSGGCSNDILVLRAKENTYPGFLYYLLSDNAFFNYAAATAKGTKMPRGDKDAIMKYVVPNLPIGIQIKTADILSALDAQISNNKAINNHLEQIAQAIFKSWFVDFEPFGGKMPKDWKKGLLGQFVDVRRGCSPRPIQNFLSDKGLPWLKISDITTLQTPFVLEIKEHIKESGLKKTIFLKSGTLVLSNSATPGIPKILGIDTCIHDGWLYFPFSLFSNEYLYLLFKHIQKDLIALGNGSIFTNLKIDILKNYVVNDPDKQTRCRFDKLVRPIFREIEYRTQESLSLSKLRNDLLPKLMSGEIDVSQFKTD